MLNMALDAKQAIMINLRNTCYNSESFRPHTDVRTTCWGPYAELGGEAP